MTIKDSPESRSLRSICYSLQAVSKVATTKKMVELAAMQESSNTLIGMALLRGLSITSVDDNSARELTAAVNAQSFGRTRVGQALQGCESQVFIGATTGHAVVIEHIQQREDWDALPVFLQNFLTSTQPPFHLIVAIEQAQLAGDDQYRNWAVPCLGVAQISDDGHPAISFKFTEAEKQTWSEERRTLTALACMEPFLRILLAGLVSNTTTQHPQAGGM